MRSKKGDLTSTQLVLIVLGVIFLVVAGYLIYTFFSTGEQTVKTTTCPAGPDREDMCKPDGVPCPTGAQKISSCKLAEETPEGDEWGTCCRFPLTMRR